MNRRMMLDRFLVLLGALPALLAGAGVEGRPRGESGTAQVQWEAQELPLVLVDGADAATARFRFRNVGSTDLRIVKVLPGCDCISAKPDKTVYRPGESGSLTATMGAVDMAKSATRIIAVQFDRPGTDAQLMVHVRGTSVVRVHPASVGWSRGDPTAERVVTVSAGNSERIELAGLRCSDPRFTVEMRRPARGDAWELIVRPADTSIALQAVLVFQVAAAGRTTTESVRLAVR